MCFRMGVSGLCVRVGGVCVGVCVCVGGRCYYLLGGSYFFDAYDTPM